MRAAHPDAGEVIALAKNPSAWVRGTNTVLLIYSLMPSSDWPTGRAVSAVQVVDRRGSVLTEWVDADRGHGLSTYWPAGQDFVAIPQYGGRPWLLRHGAPTQLTVEPGARPADQTDVHFGPGWLLDPASGTVTRESRPGCRQDAIRTDLRGRVWCLDRTKKHLTWSGENTGPTGNHTLSTSYFEYCDGGTLGVDLEVLGDVVTIGMWRADFSLDRGRTWHDVPLPLDLVGSHRSLSESEANCTHVQPLSDGRLVIQYFDAAVATDTSNTRFRAIRTPPGTIFAGVHEGILTTATRRPYGTTWVSYDGDATWLPLQVDPLVRHLLSKRMSP
jgi:hypothetical protein